MDVTEKLDEYAEYVTRKASEEFKPMNVVNVPGVSNRRARKAVSSTMRDMKRAQERVLKKQYSAVVGSVYDDDVDAHLGDFIHNDAFYRNYEGDRDEDYRDALEERMRRMHDALRPVVLAEPEGFWESARGVYDRNEAVEALGELFTASETASRFSDGIVMQVTVPVPLSKKTYTYTDESIRAFGVGEKSALKKLEMEADEAY